ncbi:MAG TPA: glycosyltransferase family 39 protein, partial [Acidimicrobiales bacterium]|nr:glycosyltransferase family 39 protein [Acidimicrobiales bacterium]
STDVAGLLVLLLVVRRLEGASLVWAVVFGAGALAARRAGFGAWSGYDPGGPGPAAARRRATVLAGVAAAAGLALTAVALAARAGAGPVAAGAALTLAAVPAILAPLEYQVLRLAGRRRPLSTATLAAGAVTLATGLVLAAGAPPVAAVAAIGAGDLVGLALARRTRPFIAGAVPSRATAAPAVEGCRRSLPVAAAASALVAAMPLVTLLASARPRADSTLVGALVVLGLLPFLAAGVVPVLVVPGVAAGSRSALKPALLLSAALGSAAVLATVAAPGPVVDLADGRLGIHAAYLALAMAGLGTALVIVHQRVADGAGRTALVLAGLALALQVALTVTARGTAADVAVDAAVSATTALLVGLAVAAAVSAPVPLTVPEAEAGDGPRAVGWAVLGLTALAAAIRLANPRALWLDEALTARLTDGSLASAVSGALAADAHPPLQTVLTWLSRRALGSGVVALRLPSLVAGVALIPLLYATGRELFDRRAGVAAAAVAAVAPALVWVSGEARPPALAAALATASLLMVVRALRSGRTSDWALFGLAGAALVWSHQLAFVHLAVLLVAAAAAVGRRRRAGQSAVPGAAGLALGGGIVAAALVALVVVRSGLGPSRVLPSLEFATAAAPGDDTSVFPVIGALLNGLLGFHPVDVTSRLLALWPLGILAALVVLGRARSSRGPLLVALVAGPLAAVLLAQVLGVPRRPTFALGWFVTSLPALMLVVGRGITQLAGTWPRARQVTAGVAAVLALALVDQAARVQPERRFDVLPAVDRVAAAARPGDVVVYEPAALGDLIRHEDPGVEARALDGVDAADLDQRRVFVLAAFSLGDGQGSVDRAVGLVRELSDERRLRSQEGRDVKVWVFE